MRTKITKFALNRIVLLVVLLAACFGFSFYYLSDQITMEVDQININKNYLKSLEDKDSIVEDLKNDYAIIRLGEDRVNGALPNKDDLVEFITEIEAIAESTDNIQNLSIADKTEKLKDKSVLKIEINLLGSYESIVNYLRALEELRYYTRVNKFSFKETQYEKLSAQVDALLYVE